MFLPGYGLNIPDVALNHDKTIIINSFDVMLWNVSLVAFSLYYENPIYCLEFIASLSTRDTLHAGICLLVKVMSTKIRHSKTIQFQERLAEIA